MCETVTDSSDMSLCTRRFRDAVKIRNIPEASMTRRPTPRRLFGVTSEPRCIPEIAPLPVDEENGSAASSSITYMTTPKKASARKPGRRLWYPPEDCNSKNQDSGHADNLAVESKQILSNGFADLLSGHIILPSEKLMKCDAETTPEYAKTKSTAVRRLFSQDNLRNENCGTPPISKARSCLFPSSKDSSSVSKLTVKKISRRSISLSNSSLAKMLKRRKPSTNAKTQQTKRSRTPDSLHQEIPEVNVPIPKSTLQRSSSKTETHAHIRSAIHQSTVDADLTGDFSKSYILPLTEGCHEDLKSILPETLAGLMCGDFEDFISSFAIIDCRYPYEYNGGHIEGAVNLYNEELIEQYLLNPITETPKIHPDTNKRWILVFHCEFSWKRGPNMARYLRIMDRQRNKEHYPALHYPEVYVLHGGYRKFFNTQKIFCEPEGYKPMKHPNHDAELQQFRHKSKSYPGEIVVKERASRTSEFRTTLLLDTDSEF